MKTQHQLYSEAQQKLAKKHETFMEIMRGPNPLTQDELRLLIKKRPEAYGCYATFLREPS